MEWHIPSISLSYNFKNMTKNNEQTIRMAYEAPRIEVITVDVEQGFATSGAQELHYDDVTIDDVEDGGIPWNTLMRE